MSHLHKPVTKTDFLNMYRSKILAQYAWAQDNAKLIRFMEGVMTTVCTKNVVWIANGAVLNDAWRALGLPGKPTLKDLRALPDEVTVTLDQAIEAFKESPNVETGKHVAEVAKQYHTDGMIEDSTFASIVLEAAKVLYPAEFVEP